MAKTNSEQVSKLQALLNKAQKISGKSMTVIFFVNQLLSYSFAMEIDQNSIKRIEFRKEPNGVIEKILYFLSGEKNDEEDRD
ncbi:hypothetical protein [Okeania sp. KiyG1]|uniref:hypothetical protein n=1 Tax=Okeania sp. KiyG1 TaxID=2720165 RepID=UPI00192488F8|nr:hypothetical protein [Okeania sp. KiyG1]GGA32746.1 hypothetical protein CYANOKiyG1_49590 [Okeania sp. KiyG1]